MVLTKVKCLHCGSEHVYKSGKQASGVQRLKCRDCFRTFQEKYTSNGAKPETKLQIIKMSLNGSGIRDIARVLDISQVTVLTVLKKLKMFLSM